MAKSEKISVITVCLNSTLTIEKTITSVISQSYPNLEFIVIDGQSTDGTMKILNQFRDQIDFLVSESDNGIYHAMNKGIEAATGDILFFLNADDYFVDDYAVKDVLNIFNENPNVDIVYGNQKFDYIDHKKTIKQPKIISRRLLLQRTVYHQTLFAKSKIFNETGRFSEQYKVVSDYEWMLKVFLTSNYDYRYIDRDISVMSTTGISLTTDYEDERIRVMRDYFSLHEIYGYYIIPNNLKKIIPAIKWRFPVTRKWIELIKRCLSQ